MRRILLAFIATAAVVALSYVVTPGSPVAETVPASMAGPAAPTGTPIPAPNSQVPAELDRLIRVFEERTTESVDALDYRTLGHHYSSRAAITGDLDDYSKAAKALESAYALASTDPQGRLAYAQAAASVHDFATALQVAEESLQTDPDNADALAIAADASVELGDLERAAELYEQLDLAAPDHPAVVARLAGFAHVTGDQDEAIPLADLAFQEARLRGERGSAMAFYPLLLSDLQLDAGHYDAALASADAAVAAAPELWLAYASRGRVLSHQGAFRQAIVAYEKALDRQADVGWQVALADLYTSIGDEGSAAALYRAAREELEASDLAIVGQELADLYTYLDIEPERALVLAEANLATRQGIDAYDTMAWALYRNGLLDEASRAIEMARSTGAQDATLIYHSAVIAHARGDFAFATAELVELLDRNPGFHPLLSRHASKLLASLAG